MSHALLAQHPLFESMREALHSGSDPTSLVVLVLCAAGVVLVLALGSRSARQVEAAAPAKVDYLTVLVDLLELSEEDRRDLKRIAGVIGLEHPASMLLSPANLSHAVHHPRLGPPQIDLITRIDVLSRRLFDQPLPDPSQAPPDAKPRIW